MKKYTITVNGTAYEVEVEDMGGAAATAPKAAAPKAALPPDCAKAGLTDKRTTNAVSNRFIILCFLNS